MAEFILKKRYKPVWLGHANIIVEGAALKICSRTNRYPV